MAVSSINTDASAVDSHSSDRTVICVFCGSSSGSSPAHIQAANALAHALYESHATLVYGGGTVGLMGEIARTLVSLAGPDSVHGIIPDALIQFEQEGRPGTVNESDRSSSIDPNVYGQTTIVPDMHTRKQLMAKKVMEGGPGSGFVALSGGYGTMEELMEVITWNQLGIHGKGVVVFNVEGYYDGLLKWVRSAVSAGFIAPGNAGIMVEALNPEEVITQLKNYKVAEGRLNLDWSQK